MFRFCENWVGRFAILCFLCGLVLSLHAREAKKPKRTGPPSYEDLQKEVKARGVLLVDVATGKVLYERNANKPYLPASTVKLMTGLLAYEQLGLKGTIIVASEAARVEPSNVPLRAGEKVTVSDMMHALLIGSDNDCALALSHKVGGSTSKFVEMMNLRAQQLGCTNTCFSNPHGLTDGHSQHTTAHDLLKIFQKTIAIPELRKIAQTRYFTMKTRIGTKTTKNHNKLLGKYEGMGPAKTGWTFAAKHTYAAAAARNGRELHLILLRSPNKWNDARLLFDYGFANLPSISATTKTSTSPEAVETSPDKSKKTAPQKAEIQALLQPIPYTIVSGDTLSDISLRHKCEVNDILQLNQGIDPKRLQPGQVIQLPSKK